ncbi:unnamed protein product [Heterobilharzia americana]|nr:unnamed protein product [Heterobilharzia americana]
MALNAENLSHNMGVKNLYESDLDDENYSSVENYGIRELRRKLHTEAEQRRRNAIKRGFESLLELVHPIKNDPAPSVRMSKSSILHKAVSMIERLGRQKHQKLSEVESLEREVKALRILCLNYEKMVQNSPNSDCRSVEPVSDEMKLEVFQMFSGALFNSFEDHIVFNSFSDLSASVINWIEESCKPEEMAFLMDSVLASIFNWSFEASVIGSRTLQFSSLSSQTERNNDIQSCCDSAGSKHPLVRSSPVYSYSPSDLQISANHSSCNPTVDPESLFLNSVKHFLFNLQVIPFLPK